MTILAADQQPLAQTVRFSEGNMIVSLVDGRTISTPIEWFPELSKASPAQLDNWQLLGDGEGIHWPDVDEDLSVLGLLEGNH